jgi:imidazolonepropionase-like amidohydrolase
MDANTLDQWEASKKNFVANEKFDADEVRDYIKLRRELILACQKNGVGLLLGCDAPQVFNVPGFSTHEELSYLVKSGLTPFQALQTGTVNVGKYLGIENLGQIKEGYIADLVLLNKNPLVDIANSQAINGVMIRGHWISKEEITIGYKKLEKQ